MAKVDWKKLALAFFYSDIKTMAQQMLGGMVFGIPVDLVMAGIGYWKSDTWWGETLLIASVANLGTQKSLMLGPLFAPRQGATTQSTTAYEVIG